MMAMRNTSVNRRRPKASGFTLLEVLIAMAIFSIISLASFSIFDTVFESDDKSKASNARLNELNRAFMVIERDMLQLARRTVRINGEAPSDKYLHMDDQGFFSETNALAFVRSGWSNPGYMLPRSDLQSVAYQLDDETLNRLHFNFVDPVVGAEPKVRPLITQVDDVKFEFYRQGKWQKELIGKNLPQALAIIIQTKDFGEIRRQFLIPGDQDKTSGDDDE
ncbi:MAG: type II secretion system protein GspJ [Colwelliaceae bacterium]|nr:type II secretion system protein GspJ [Colwelliaceae bacterium]|tara:strand:+ start:478 stop:1140 length:663 start_codon:yes stop_codon:yes gene_type:complete